MSIAYDVIGSFQHSLSSATLGSIAVNPTANDTVVAFCIFNNGSANSGITATFGGASMTQVGSTYYLGTPTGYATYIAAFYKSGVSSGSQNVVFTTAVASVGMQGGADAYSGVGSVSATLAANNGNSTSLSLSSVSSATGHRVVNFCASVAAAATFSSYSQTSRGTDAGLWGVLIGDVAGASTVSFSATVPSNGWGAVAVDLVPLLTGTANSTITVGGSTTGRKGYLSTANRSIAITPSAADQNIFGTANRAITFSPTVTSVKGLRSTANTTATFTRTTTALQHGLSAVLSKLAANQSSTITVLGDSTSYGFGDTVGSPWVHGWVGRLGVLLGQYYNVNVSIASWNDQSQIAGQTGYPDNGASGQFYDSAYSLYTSSLGGGAGTLLLLDGAACGEDVLYLSNGTRLPILLATATDAIICATLINDYALDSDTTSTYVSRYETWLTDIQALQPGIPITVTNENVTNATYDSNLASLATALWTALASQPVTYNGTAANWAGVTMLDTRAAYNDPLNQVDPSSYLAGVHPQAAGYAAQASWMLNQLAPGVVSNFTGTANRTITASTTITDKFGYKQTANQSITVNRSVTSTEHSSGTANRSITFTPAVSGGFSGTANRSVAFTRSATIAARGTANRTATFTRTVAGVDLDGAARSIAFSVTAAGRRELHSTANTGLAVSAIASYNSHLSGTADTAIGWASSAWDGQHFVVSASWSGVSGQVVFTEPGGAALTIQIVDGTLNVALPVIDGLYLVQFQDLITNEGPAAIDPFAFLCPPSGVVDLNDIVGPAPILHELGSRTVLES